MICLSGFRIVNFMLNYFNLLIVGLNVLDIMICLQSILIDVSEIFCCDCLFLNFEVWLILVWCFLDFYVKYLIDIFGNVLCVF